MINEENYNVIESIIIQICFSRQKKDKGNWWYERNENTMALHVYRKALQYFGAAGEIV